jgi:thioredoxin-like negative regulator of GroEL
MEPVLEKFLQESGNTVKLVKIDGGIHVNLMKSMNVSSLPHFIMYNNGKKVWAKQGLVSLEELKAVLAESMGSARK